MDDEICFLTNVPAPYKIGLYNAIASRCRLHVIFLAQTEYMRQWKVGFDRARFSYEFCRSRRLKLPRYESSYFFTVDPIVALFKRRPCVLIVGPYSQPAMLVTILAALLTRIPVVIWYESHRLSSLGGGGISMVNRTIKRLLFRFASAVVVPGRASKAEVTGYGFPQNKLFVAPHSVDNRFFATPAGRWKGVERQEGVFTFLYVGQFIPRKNVTGLIDAFCEEFSSGEPVRLLLAGGRLEEGSYPTSNRITSLGFVQTEDVPDLLGVADALVLPSWKEVWGLVVNEAAASGKILLVSNRCGSAEIVREGENGYTFDPADKADFRRKLRMIAEAGVAYGAASIQQDLEDRYNFDRMADAFLSAVESAGY